MDKTTKYVALRVPGKGWTVAKIVGTKSTGRKVIPVAGYSDSYTMHQAQVAADALQREERK